MSVLRLYPVVLVIGQDLSKERIVTVPKQSLTLKQIIERYTRKMPLDVTTKDAVYEDRFVDLDKMAHADITYQLDYAEELKNRLNSTRADVKAHNAKQKAKAEAVILEEARQNMAKSAGGGSAGLAKAPPS